MQGEWLRNRVQKLCLCGKNRLTGSFSFKDCLRNGKASVERYGKRPEGREASRSLFHARFVQSENPSRALIQMRKAQRVFKGAKQR